MKKLFVPFLVFFILGIYHFRKFFDKLMNPLKGGKALEACLYAIYESHASQAALACKKIREQNPMSTL